MRRASQAPKTYVLRLKEPLGVRTDRFWRMGRAKSHNPAGICARATHQHKRPHFDTAWVTTGRFHSPPPMTGMHSYPDAMGITRRNPVGLVSRPGLAVGLAKLFAPQAYAASFMSRICSKAPQNSRFGAIHIVL